MHYSKIRSIVLTVILMFASLAAFGAVGGTAVIAILFALAAWVRASEMRRTRFVRAVAILIGLAAVVALVLHGAKAAREIARSMQCERNLIQIGNAVRNYWDANGCYPPTCSYDKSGKPMHSWRLLIVPYLDASATYASCNFSEPWDSPTNLRLLKDNKSVFKCPMDHTAYALGSTTTSYVAIVGNRAQWRHGRAERPDPNHESADLKRNNQATDTFVVTEMHDSEIQWTEPKDIEFSNVATLNSKAAKNSHARNNGYFYHQTPALNAVLVHGDMIFVFPWDSRRSLISGLLPPQTPLDPESTSIERHRSSKGDTELFQEELQLDWLHVIGLPVWIAALALLVYQGLVTHGKRGQVSNRK